MSKSAHGSALPRTNAMRMLDAARIPYEVLTYEVDENDLSGVHIAEQLSYPPEMIFKTLVAHGDRTGYLVFCIPVALEIDLRTAASLTGNKKIEMVHVKDLLSLTGYIRGGCSPIGMKGRARNVLLRPSSLCVFTLPAGPSGPPFRARDCVLRPSAAIHEMKAS